MSPLDQVIAIGIAAGWTPTSLGWWHHPTYPDTCHLPNYLSDLNAMRDAKLFALSGDTWNRYVLHLAKVIALPATDRMRPDVYRNTKVRVPTNELLSASAAQEAEALLRTLKKWTDD